MGLEITKINIKDISPAHYNPRKIREEEMRSLKKSMNKFGLVDPIIVNLKNNRIIGGHQRYEVLFNEDENQELNLVKLGNVGWAYVDEELEIKDEAHEKALNLALNRIKGEFDIIKLNPILDELAEFNLDHLTGFDIELEDIDYTFINNDDEEEEDYGGIDDYDYSVENNTNSNISYSLSETSSDEGSHHESIEKNHFVEKGDIYKIGNNIILYGEYNQENMDKLLNSYGNESIQFNELLKSDSIRVPLKYYIIESIDLVEKLIRKNYKYSDKLN